MLVIDVWGILSFLFWVGIVIFAIFILGGIFSVLADVLATWRKEGVVYMIIMLVMSAGLGVIFVKILIAKANGTW